MLKITKGLKPFVNDDTDGITTYTDGEGHKYVRVKEDGEDFCIAAHDYDGNGEFIMHGKHAFDWNEVMKMLKTDGLTMFTKEQAQICIDYLPEINAKLKEIGGEPLKTKWYWTSTECAHKSLAWVYDSVDADGVVHFIPCSKELFYVVRPVINL